MKRYTLQMAFAALAAQAADYLKRTGQAVRMRFVPGVVIDASDRRYRTDAHGCLRRVEPKPYRGKAERKAQKRQRARDRRADLFTPCPDLSATPPNQSPL